MSIIKLRQQESGLVSIIVAIAFISIMALVTTSFALISRREARQALDRQLSTQAFYAAESGVSDAIEAARGGLTNVNSCDQVGSVGNPDLGNNISYSCVLINETPSSIEFDVPVNESKVVRVQSANPISRLRISWQDAGGRTIFANSANPLFPQQNYNSTTPSSYANNTGLVRSLIIPVTGNLNRTELINNSQTLFLYPAQASAGQVGTHNYQPGQTAQGGIVDGQCNTANPPNLPQYCNVEINGLDGSGAGYFYVNLRGIYRSSKVTIQALDGGGNPMPLLNGQAVIDSTGKANDVLRRIQVRVPLGADYFVPDFALETAESICKQIYTTPVSVTDACTYR